MTEILNVSVTALPVQDRILIIVCNYAEVLERPDISENSERWLAWGGG